MSRAFFYLLSTVLLILFSSALGYAQDNLVGYYPFSGDASDSSGYANDGTVYGATLTEDRFGNPESAYLFDGIDDYIHTNSSFDYDERSVSVWIKVNSDENNHQAILNQDSSELNYGAFGMSYREGRLYFREGETEENLYLPISRDQWYHLVMARKAGIVNIYINGDLVATEVAENTGSITHQNEKLLVGTTRLIDRFFDGIIDDIRIYNYELNSSQVYDLYTDNNWPDTGYEIKGLVGYYPFNGDASDSSGYANDGTVYGATLTEDRFGNPESAYLFDGDDFIDLGVEKDYEFGTGDFSVSAWFKAEDLDKRRYQIIRKGLNHHTLGESRWVLSLEGDGRARIVFEDAEHGYSEIVALGQQSFLDNKWHHMVAVFDRDSVLKVYIDNELEILDHSIVNYQGNITNESDVHAYIGRSETLNEDNNFIGSLDDIRIYTTALKTSDINGLYHTGGWPVDNTDENLVAYYPFNGDAVDQTKNENTGLIEGAELTNDRFGNRNSAFQFNGRGFINFGDSDIIEFEEGDFALSTWVKVNNQGQSQYQILRKGLDNRTYGEGRWVLSLDEEGKLRIILEDAEHGNDNLRVNGTTSLLDGRWHHLAVVFDRDSLLSAYVDNKLEVSSDEIKEYQGSISNTQMINMYAGRSNNPAYDLFMIGKIDDIRVYNSTIDRQTIQELYTEGGWIPPEYSEDLVGYYPFTNNAGDSSGFNNHGEIHGANLTSDRFNEANRAYEFDGLNDYILIDTPAPFFSNTDFSITFWAQGISTTGDFKGLIASQNGAPFGIFIDDGDRVMFSIQNNHIPLNLVAENLYTDPGLWYRYSVVFRAGDYLRLFRNGEEIGVLNGSIPESIDKSSSEISIGTLLGDGPGDTGDYFFRGSIDDIKIFSYALEATEVQDLYLDEKRTLVSNENQDPEFPQSNRLYQNYPNPFNPTTVIKFEISRTAPVSLKVYDLTGRVVATLVENTRQAGVHEVVFDASGIASGVYLYELKTPEFSRFKKFTLIK